VARLIFRRAAGFFDGLPEITTPRRKIQRLAEFSDGSLDFFGVPLDFFDGPLENFAGAWRQEEGHKRGVPVGAPPSGLQDFAVG
jgi:hypothetical protein